MSGLYKGFIATKGKEPIEKYKGLDTFRTYNEIRSQPEFAGVMKDDVLFIDVDEMHQAETLLEIVKHYNLQCRVTRTSRGMHFTMRNTGDIDKCGTHLKLACGLTADIKTGGKPETLKYEGEERRCEYGTIDPELGEYDEVPKWLYPVQTKMDFLNTEARNSDFFGYILVLQSQLAMNKDECRECIQIINDFVLPEPLEQSELDVILRDEAFEKPVFFDGKKFLHDSFARWLMNQHHIVRLNGQLHIYKDGIYIPGYRNIEYVMLQSHPQLRDSQRKEVLKYLEVLCVDESKPADARYIAFQNGIYDLVDDVLRDFSSDMVITNRIPWNYVPDAYSEVADNTLNKLACNDVEIRKLLEEAVGYCFYRRNELSLSLFFTGEKANGKSTYLQMIQDVLGEQNTSALALDELDERFAVATMFGKLANIGDDISDEFLQGKSIAHFKKIVSGNRVKAENKGQDAFFYKPIIKLIFSTNQIPRMRDKTGAVLRRMVIIPFNARFTKDDPDFDPYIAYKLKEPDVMEYMIQVGIQGLRRIIEQSGFTPSQKVKRELKEYEEYNNPILLFLNEIEDIDVDITNNETKSVYSAYEMFCHDNGFQTMGLSNFSKEICRQYGYVCKTQRQEGKRVRIFAKNM